MKNGLQHRCFPVNIAEFLRTPFLTERLRWLLQQAVYCRALEDCLIIKRKQSRSSHPEVFCKKSVLEVLVFLQASGLNWKRDPGTGVFLWILQKFLRTPLVASSDSLTMSKNGFTRTSLVFKCFSLLIDDLLFISYYIWVEKVFPVATIIFHRQRFDANKAISCCL